MSLKTFVYGLGLGAGFMYLYDPERGIRRRTLIRDRWAGFLNDTDDLIGEGTRDLSNRARGLTAEMRSMVTGEQATDEVLAQRVRSKIGPVVSHPRGIQVEASNGRVALSGPILASGVQPLLTRVALVRGVTGIDNRLEVREDPANMPAFQGEPAGAGRMQEAWPPGFRLLAAAGGGLLVLSGLLRGGIIGRARTLFGLSLLARGMRNQGLRGMVGLSDDSEAVAMKASIEKGKTTAHDRVVTRDQVYQSQRQKSTGRQDRVGGTGVYPASDLEEAPDDAQARGMGSWGQGDRGAAGYEDSGSSELTGLGEETDFGSVIPGPDKP